ncbi:hypothetical protein XH83_25950 [Bradyrhizobium sp. CCBAU 53351]|nr:hypothetical protein XH83_25950 [Bradyrhizobium sp. CCBAU 53351]
MCAVRRRVKQVKSFRERLIEEAAKFRAAAEELPPGTQRELLMRRVHQSERALEISDLLAKPKSSPPVLDHARGATNAASHLTPSVPVFKPRRVEEGLAEVQMTASRLLRRTPAKPE